MIVSYLDTTAFVKLLVDEPGSVDAKSLWDEAGVVITGRLTYPEVRAALAAARRDRRLTPRTHRKVVDAFEQVWVMVNKVELAPALARMGGELAERRALRGYDAVHLATALAAMERGGLFVSWDRRLVKAAVAEGLAVAPPTA
jgi:uncharacterized protein